MSKRASKLLRRALAALAITLAVFAVSSFFVGEFIRLKINSAAVGSPVVWTWIGSEYGQLTLGFERLPPVFDAAIEKGTAQKIPGLYKASIGPSLWVGCMVAGNIPAHSTMDHWWWFHITNLDLQAPSPTTNPVAPRGAATYPIHLWNLSIPYWFLMLPAVAYLLYRLVDLPGNRRRKRLAAGQCVVCGYDLRHTPDRCPECGLVPGAAPPPRRRFLHIESTRGDVAARICLYSIAVAVWSSVFVVAYYRFYRK